MSVISIFTSAFCQADQVVDAISKKTGYRVVTDKNIVERAAEACEIEEAKIAKSFSSKTSLFNKFTHEKDLSIACLKMGVSDVLGDDELIVYGLSAMLIPRSISHVLRACIVAERGFRKSLALRQSGLGEKEAEKLIQSSDHECSAWIKRLYGKADPWDASLYDLVIPTKRLSVEEAVELIIENLGKTVVKTSAQSKKAVKDFQLSSKVEEALYREGHDVDVAADDGNLTLTINKHVLLLSRLEEDLKSICSAITGVRSVTTKVGEGYYQADIYRKYDFKVPSKVLLVDDEREFVQTLSERLTMRDMGSAVAYDGESALELIHEDEPEVMVLDLKMPGIDGIEVLRRVKKERPDIEVIILTGHGTESDRKTCMELGAFAYLQKPVNIDLLSDSLRKANDKIQAKKKDG